MSKILFKGTPEQQANNFKDALEAIDNKAAITKQDMETFKRHAQEKRKQGKTDEAKQFENSADKLECKHLVYVDVLRTIKAHVE